MSTSTTSIWHKPRRCRPRPEVRSDRIIGLISTIKGGGGFEIPEFIILSQVGIAENTVWVCDDPRFEHPQIADLDLWCYESELLAQVAEAHPELEGL